MLDRAEFLAYLRHMARRKRVVHLPLPRTGYTIERRLALTRHLAREREGDLRYTEDFWAFDPTLGYDLSNVRRLPRKDERAPEVLAEDDLPF